MEFEMVANMEDQVAYCSEKVQNLEILQMIIESSLPDYEDADPDSAEKAFEFYLLAVILDSELEDLDQFIRYLLTEIGDSRRDQHSSQLGETLNSAEKSLKQLQDQVTKMKAQSAKFERVLPIGGTESSVADEREGSLMDEKPKCHVSQMLEKSLARDLDLEKKLGLLEIENSYNEESMADILQKLFQAESISVVMMETSKGLILKLQEAQFSLNCSFQREKEIQTKLQEAQFSLDFSLQKEKEMRMKLQEAQFSLDSSLQKEKEMQTKLQEAQFSLDCSLQREKAMQSKLQEDHLSLNSSFEREEMKLVNQVNSLNAALKESQERFSMTTTVLKDQVNYLEKKLKFSVQTAEEAEKRAENAETQLKLLEQANSNLSREKISNEKLVSVNEELLNAEIEAISEERDVLRSSLGDMEILIEDLKNRVLQGDSKCSSLVETNLKLSEEIVSMRDRLGFLEGSLLRAEETKTASAKDFVARAKVIHDLLMKFSSERDRLQAEVSRLTRNGNYSSSHENQDEAKFHVHEKWDKQPTQDQKAEVAGRTSGIDENFEAVRSIEVQVLGPKFVLTAVVVLVISALGFYVFQMENCPL